jgi:uncharacterized RDD family membrane protein YckC
MTLRSRLSFTPEERVARAGFWARAAAALIDGIVVAVLYFIVAAAVIVVATSSDASSRRSELALRVAGSVLVLAYTSTEVWFAGTPAKLLLGMRIGAAAGGPADRWTLALRWSSKYFGSWLGLINAVTGDAGSYFLAGWMNTVVLTGCLQALDEYRRTWHDQWARTAVWRRGAGKFPRPAAPPAPPPLQPESRPATLGADDGPRV